MSKEQKKPNNNSKKIARGPDGRLKKGVILNPLGRPKGSKNFYSDFCDAIKQIKDKNTGESLTEIHIIKIGLEKMLKGEARFESLYQDLMDRVYGKAAQSLAITDQDGNALPITNFVITPIEDDKPDPGKNS